MGKNLVPLVSVRLPAEDRQKLVTYAEYNNTTVNALIKAAIAFYLQYH